MTNKLVYAFSTASNRSVPFFARLLPEVRALIREYLDILDQMALRRCCRRLAQEDPLRDPFPANWKWQSFVTDPSLCDATRGILTFVFRHLVGRLPHRILALAQFRSEQVSRAEPRHMPGEIRIIWPTVYLATSPEFVAEYGDGNDDVSRIQIPWILADCLCVWFATPCQKNPWQHGGTDGPVVVDRFRDYLDAQFAE